ncbi:MAG: hypothetical protein DI599_08450 [Pseudomonas kuykendallii]|uniref:Secretin/TonB short N-terminal domain-containing protein n=1 Tax=Pseudomonas kuykendallii TaxID=1007099 RepID=A0A2W5CYI9_9PSED|nr:MAG: hypothetical protein DI599_08450 [Pseudomonas kuykendallii]
MSRHTPPRSTSLLRSSPCLSPLGVAINRALLGAVLALPVAGLVQVQPAWAQSVVAQHDFAIAAGSLESALNSFAATTGVSLSYSPETVRGLQSPGVQGQLSADEALQRLLSGSGLQVTRRPAATIRCCRRRKPARRCNSMPSRSPVPAWARPPRTPVPTPPARPAPPPACRCRSARRRSRSR